MLEGLLFDLQVIEVGHHADLGAVHTLREGDGFGDARQNVRLRAIQRLDADTDAKAVEIGITAEKDSILLYYEIRGILPESVAWQVDRIIGEEKLHLGELVDLKKSLEEGTEGEK